MKKKIHFTEFLETCKVKGLQDNIKVIKIHNDEQFNKLIGIFKKYDLFEISASDIAMYPIYITNYGYIIKEYLEFHKNYFFINYITPMGVKVKSYRLYDYDEVDFTYKERGGKENE